MKTYSELVIILISFIQEIDWLNLKAYTETCWIPFTMVQWWQRDGMMVRWWKRDGAMVKTQWYERETTILRWWNNDCTMVKQRRLDEWKRDGTLVKDDVTMVKIR
jgi:hypothetical protein